MVQPPKEIDHGYMVHDYQLPTRAIGRGLRPLQRRGYCPFAILAEMVEHVDETARGGTTRPHTGCFLLTSHPPLVVDHSNNKQQFGSKVSKPNYLNFLKLKLNRTTKMLNRTV